ncbi:MAG: hypothetical protein WC663_03325 [Patescibacteria group bacterium]|jgi:hypothetical protein
MWLNRQISFVKVVVNSFRPIMAELIKGKKAQIKDRFVFLWMRKRIEFLSFVILTIIFLILGLGINWSEKEVVIVEKTNYRKTEDETEHINPSLLSVPYVERNKFRVIETNDEIVSDKKVLKRKIKINWIRVMLDKDKEVNEDTRNFVRSELSLVRYRCFAYYNKHVEVVCRGKNHFCTVSFEVYLDQKKYRMEFRSLVSASGYDKIDRWVVFIWADDKRKTDIDKKDLVEKIVNLRSNCTPFSSE